MTGGMAKKLRFFYLPSFLLISCSHFYFVIFFLSLGLSSPTYCYISKNMACLGCNISSEKRLIRQEERRYADGQSNKKKVIQVHMKLKLCLCSFSASVDILPLLIKLQQILCSFILE